ncbi:MAG: hypothetical protein IKL68_02295 [Clostridia bacterium]|nr:hypothetical protein [Clostridia bacterium]
MKYFGHILEYNITPSNINFAGQAVKTENYIVFFSGRLFSVCNKKMHLIESETAKTILNLYTTFGEDFLNHIDGSFSIGIIDFKNKEVFLAADKFSTKPLYYSSTPDEFIFSNTIQELLSNSSIKACISKDEICEIFGFGPAHTPGKTYFKDIFKIQPGHYAILNKDRFKEFCYWDLKEHKNLETIEENINTSKELVISAFKRDFSLGCASMLSGGLDSSILTMLAAKETNSLKTYSIDYENNNINFTGSSYQPTQDKDFVKIMADKLNTIHTTFTFSAKDLFNSLKDAMLAREMPGMADVDSSILLFLKSIKQDGINTILSGECSDEIFGGYPWYYKENLMHSYPFPWAKSLELRENILNTNIVSKEYLEEYIKNKVTSNDDLDFENVFSYNCSNTIKWFMMCLIERTERMANYVGIDVRTPFADYKLFEYIYNISAKRKLGLESNNTPVEKYILRKAFEKDLPESIVYRKKSPFPKTYDPKYLELLEKEIKNILDNSTSPLLKIINVEFLYNLLESHGTNIKENWFGQLMTYPQTLAYLIQVNMWLIEFDIKIEI